MDPFLIGVLDQLTVTPEDIETMSKPMEEWTREEILRMNERVKEIFGCTERE